MNTTKNIYFRMIFSLIIMAASNAHAEIVIYTLNNVILNDGGQITGTFSWTYDAGDFENGIGQFTALEIPYTIYSLADGNLNIEIQTDSIEISGNGDYHDVGLDITLFLSQPLTPTQSVPIDLDLSFFECCGNGFHDQPFRSGGIAPNSLITIATAHSVLVTRGTHVSGGIVELADSDNLDLSIRRSTVDIQSRTEFEVEAVSPTASPASLEVTLEGAVFARSEVNQVIELYDYVAAAWELVDTRNATNMIDSTATVGATGDLSRFVDQTTFSVEARIRFQSLSPRQRFSSNTDQFIWTIGQ